MLLHVPDPSPPEAAVPPAPGPATPAGVDGDPGRFAGAMLGAVAQQLARTVHG